MSCLRPVELQRKLGYALVRLLPSPNVVHVGLEVKQEAWHKNSLRTPWHKINNLKQMINELTLRGESLFRVAQSESGAFITGAIFDFFVFKLNLEMRKAQQSR